MPAVVKEKVNNKKHFEIKTNHKPKTFFNNDSTYNKDGAELLFKIDEFIKPLYEEYIEKGFNIREIQQIINISVTTNEIHNSVKLSEKLYQEARKQFLDDRKF